MSTDRLSFFIALYEVTCVIAYFDIVISCSLQVSPLFLLHDGWLWNVGLVSAGKVLVCTVLRIVRCCSACHHVRAEHHIGRLLTLLDVPGRWRMISFIGRGDLWLELEHVEWVGGVLVGWVDRNSGSFLKLKRLSVGSIVILRYEITGLRIVQLDSLLMITVRLLDYSVGAVSPSLRTAVVIYHGLKAVFIIWN